LSLFAGLAPASKVLEVGTHLDPVLLDPKRDQVVDMVRSVSLSTFSL
jgi:hypothetical protein